MENSIEARSDSKYVVEVECKLRKNCIFKHFYNTVLLGKRNSETVHVHILIFFHMVTVQALRFGSEINFRNRYSDLLSSLLFVTKTSLEHVCVQKVCHILKRAPSFGIDHWCEWPLNNGFEGLSGLSLGDCVGKAAANYYQGSYCFTSEVHGVSCRTSKFVLSTQQPPPHAKQTCTSEWGGCAEERERKGEKEKELGHVVGREKLGFCI